MRAIVFGAHYPTLLSPLSRTGPLMAVSHWGNVSLYPRVTRRYVSGLTEQTETETEIALFVQIWSLPFLFVVMNPFTGIRLI